MLNAVPNVLSGEINTSGMMDLGKEKKITDKKKATHIYFLINSLQSVTNAPWGSRRIIRFSELEMQVLFCFEHCENLQGLGVILQAAIQGL